MAKKRAKEVTSTPLGNPRVFRIGRKRFVIGLFWQVAENGRTVRKEARDLAHERGIQADLHLKRVKEQSGEAQFALARTSDGVARKAISAAAVLTDEVPQESWAGVFPLNDGWWYVRVRNNMILPQGDGFYDDETDARNRVRLDIADGGFERVFAPEGWEDNADHIDFERILAGARGPQVIDINPAKAHRGTLITVGLMAVSLLIGWQGWSYYQSLNAADERQEEAREKFKENINKPKEKKEIPPPWHSRPMPSDVIYSCAQGMTKLSTNAPGFELEQIRCNGRQARYYWQRQERSNIRWIERWIERQHDYDVNVNPAGETVTVNVPVEGGEPRQPEPIYPAKIVRNGLISLGQATDTNVRTGDVRRWEPPGRFDPQSYKRPNYATMAIEIQVSSVDDWVEILDDIPGLVINTVTWDHPSKSYEITGEVYVQS